MEEKRVITNKLKNKKKDVILADNIIETPRKKEEENKQSKNTTNVIDNNIQNPLLKDSTQLVAEGEQAPVIDTTVDRGVSRDENSKQSTANADKAKVKDQSDEVVNNNIMNQIIFNIQLLFSVEKLLEKKIYEIFLNFLSIDHLKAVLEERDCIEICGNILCNKHIEKPKTKKYFYDSRKKEFAKEDMLSFFCDVRCFQAFKDAIKIANNFDFLRLFKFESLFIMFNTKNYYPNEIYLKKISHLTKILFESSLKKIDDVTLDMLKAKYDNYFNDKAKKEENIIKADDEVKAEEGQNIALNQVFDEKLHIIK